VKSVSGRCHLIANHMPVDLIVFAKLIVSTLQCHDEHRNLDGANSKTVMASIRHEAASEDDATTHAARFGEAVVEL
jgi:hypothetical protein